MTPTPPETPECPHGCVNGVITDSDLGGDGTSSYCPLHGPLARVPDRHVEEEQRWTIYVCPKCERVFAHPGGCGHCEPWPRTGHPRLELRGVEVVPAEQRDQAIKERDEAEAVTRATEAETFVWKRHARAAEAEVARLREDAKRASKLEQDLYADCARLQSELDQVREGIEQLANDLVRIGAISRHDLPIKGRGIIVERLRSLLEGEKRNDLSSPPSSSGGQ